MKRKTIVNILKVLSYVITTVIGYLSNAVI